jgi:DNA-binding transcriptional LysR family regulator
MLLQQLKIFHAVAKHSGFSRASEYLGLSQPALSISIKKLEDDFGIQLFERFGRRIRLTDAGKIVEEYVARIMCDVSEMRQAVDEIKGLEGGQLRCGAVTTVAIYLLPKTLVAFRKRFPKVETQLFVGRGAEIAKKVLSNELDLGFVGGAEPTSSTLNVRGYFTDELVVITSRDHFLAGVERVSPKRLSGLPLILGRKESYVRKMIEQNLEAAAIQCRHVMEVENTEVIKAAVAEGLGISIISLARIPHEIKNGLLIPIRILGVPMKREFWVIMRKGKVPSGPMKAFLELVG